MLPDGYSWRRATTADAAAIQAIVAASDIAIIGHAACSLDDIRDQLTEPGFVIDADTWLVHAADGTLAGYAWTYGRGTGEYIDLDVITRDPALRDWLFDQTLVRAAELARSGAHPEATLDLGVYRANQAMSAAAEARGFHHAATFYRMRIDHDPVAAPVPVAPEDVTLRSGPGDLDFRRTAHDVLVTSFKGHFGFGPQPFERWHSIIEQSAVFSWEQLTLAYLGSEPAAILLTSDSHLDLENCGSVDDLGVLPGHREIPAAARFRHRHRGRPGRHGPVRRLQQRHRCPAPLRKRRHAPGPHDRQVVPDDLTGRTAGIRGPDPGDPGDQPGTRSRKPCTLRSWPSSVSTATSKPTTIASAPAGASSQVNRARLWWASTGPASRRPRPGNCRCTPAIVASMASRPSATTSGST
jgi:mycothiol synthase